MKLRLLEQTYKGWDFCENSLHLTISKLRRELWWGDVHLPQLLDPKLFSKNSQAKLQHYIPLTCKNKGFLWIFEKKKLEKAVVHTIDEEKKPLKLMLATWY